MESCPTNYQEWETAAKLKNCETTAAQQICAKAEIFVYHCVINGFENETLEVCAPQKLITGILIDLHFVKYICNFDEIIKLDIAYRMRRNDEKCLQCLSGHCTEFNVDGGVIQIHSPTQCGKDKFPSCSKLYKSSEAYKCKSTNFQNVFFF